MPLVTPKDKSSTRGPAGLSSTAAGGKSGEDEALPEEEQSLAVTYLKKRTSMKESHFWASPSKRKRSKLDSLVQEPGEISIDFIADLFVFFLHSYL